MFSSLPVNVSCIKLDIIQGGAKTETSKLFLLVRVEGLEPPCLAAPDPKSGMSTNFTTPAIPV